MQTNRVFLPLILVAGCLTGCMSQIPPVKEFADRSVGTPISNLFVTVNRPGSYVARTGSKIQRYELENGNTEYVEPIRENCLVHWEVNASGIIVGYRTEGDRCY